MQFAIANWMVIVTNKLLLQTKAKELTLHYLWVLSNSFSIGCMHLITFVPYIIGSVVLSYEAAGIVSAVIELPVANVEMAFFKLLGLQLIGGSAKQSNAITSAKNGFVHSIMQLISSVAIFVIVFIIVWSMIGKHLTTTALTKK